MIATDVASRGLDVEDLQYVINYDYPNSSENYVHRIGRTGRCQQLGTSYTFFTPDNAKQARELISVLEEAGQSPPQNLLDLSRSVGNGNGRNNNKRWQTQSNNQQQQRNNPLNYQAGGSGVNNSYTPKQYQNSTPHYQQQHQPHQADGGNIYQNSGGVGTWNNRGNNQVCGGGVGQDANAAGRSYRPRAAFGSGGPRPMMGYPSHVPAHIQHHPQQPQNGAFMPQQQYRPRGQYMPNNGGGNVPRFQQYQKREYQQNHYDKQQNSIVNGAELQQQHPHQHHQQQNAMNGINANAAAAQHQQQVNVAANIAAAVAAAGGQVGGDYPNGTY